MMMLENDDDAKVYCDDTQTSDRDVVNSNMTRILPVLKNAFSHGHECVRKYSRMSASFHAPGFANEDKFVSVSTSRVIELHTGPISPPILHMLATLGSGHDSSLAHPGALIVS